MPITTFRKVLLREYVVNSDFFFLTLSNITECLFDFSSICLSFIQIPTDVNIVKAILGKIPLH